MLNDKVSLSKTKPEDLYREFGGKLKTIDDGSGLTFKSIEEWDNYLHKEKIMKQVEKLREFLKVRSNRWWLGTRSEVGMSPGPAITPICLCESMDIKYLVEYICKDIYGINAYNYSKVPQKFIKTQIGYGLARDLSSITSFSKLAFCHTFLRYDSFIVRGDKLIGVINWRFAGYYPIEFDEVIRKYIEYV
ncbi:hypothetical protein DL89DRAFT_271279 [Linderina pennispora]|uniref:Uncharacterized protein n=1 Tax=Linderina pennispora TaxID=61395 RepID=A0A1Y1VWT2_9FUNG|nr:uncharacterized protein DL89DRAFT_271279 [Linderina pennispora]ORX65204.1 hypothetical protein DL89DRAFT_271279 [Linderina pennispora]